MITLLRGTRLGTFAQEPQDFSRRLPRAEGARSRLLCASKLSPAVRMVRSCAGVGLAQCLV
jgi:hypothetical protein